MYTYTCIHTEAMCVCACVSTCICESPPLGDPSICRHHEALRSQSWEAGSPAFSWFCTPPRQWDPSIPMCLTRVESMQKGWFLHLCASRQIDGMPNDRKISSLRLTIRKKKSDAQRTNTVRQEKNKGMTRTHTHVHTHTHSHTCKYTHIHTAWSRTRTHTQYTHTQTQWHSPSVSLSLTHTHDSSDTNTHTFSLLYTFPHTPVHKNEWLQWFTSYRRHACTTYRRRACLE